MLDDMKKILVVALVLVSTTGMYAQTKVNLWDTFAKTKFEPKYHEKLGEYLFFPTFPAELKALVGKEVTIEGYYVPFAPEGGNYVILSKFPMSQCFFCGGGGPESIVEVYFAKSLPKFQVDDLVTVKGKLKLNQDDMDHSFFVVEQCVIVSK